MRFDANFLLLAASYDEMFKSVLAFNPVLKATIDSKIAWAKRVLRKQDRIVWFLRFYRASLAQRLAGLSNEAEKLHDQYQNELVAKGAPYNWGWPMGDISLFMEQMEHFLGLPSPKIQNFVFKSQNPSDVITEFKELEEEYAGARRGLVEPQKEDKIILQFADGWAWWQLPRASCTAEAQAMGHCGNSPQAGNPNMSILSLREPKKFGKETLWEPHCTFIYNKNGYLGEMKGKSNNKPAERYHPYIVELLKLPMIKGVIGGGYKPENNFKLKDLSENLRNNLIQARPDFANPKNEAAIGRIIEILQLAPDAWDAEQERFTVKQWATGVEFIGDVGGREANDVLDCYRGNCFSEAPTLDNLFEILEDARNPSKWRLNSPQSLKYEDKPKRDYVENFGYRLMYENPGRIPAGYDPASDEDVKNLLYNLTDEGTSFDDICPAITELGHLFASKYATSDEAGYELETILEYAAAEHPSNANDIEVGDVDDPVYIYADLDKAMNFAQLVEDGEDIPDWTEGISIPVDSDWESRWSESNSDYRVQKLDEAFGERPRKPVPEGQKRLFKDPKSPEEAQRHGITVSKLKRPRNTSSFLNKNAGIPQNLKKLKKPVSKEYDAVKFIYDWFVSNDIDSISWKIFQKNFQQFSQKYNQLFTQIRGNRPQITQQDLKTYLESNAEAQKDYGISFSEYDDPEQSFREVKQLVLQINQGASAKRILNQDPLLEQYVSMVGQSSEMSKHPANRTTVGWLRIDFINEEWLLVDEVQSDLVNSVTQAKTIVQADSFEDFLERIESPKVKAMVIEQVSPDRFYSVKEQFADAGYSLEKLEEIRRSLISLFEDWAEYAISSLIEIARQHGIKQVAINTAEGIARRDNSVESEKLKIYYDHLAKSFGFQKQQVNVGDLQGDFWVRTASAKDSWKAAFLQ